MTAAVLSLVPLIKDEPLAPYNAGRKEPQPIPAEPMPKHAPIPHEMLGYDSTYTHNITEQFLQDHLRYAQERLRDNQEPYSFEAAAISLYLDIDKGHEKAQTDYERIWGWTRKIARNRWPRLLEKIEQMQTAFGRRGEVKVGATEGPRRGHKKGDSSKKPTPRGHGGATEGPTYYPILNPKTEEIGISSCSEKPKTASSEPVAHDLFHLLAHLTYSLDRKHNLGAVEVDLIVRYSFAAETYASFEILSRRNRMRHLDGVSFWYIYRLVKLDIIEHIGKE